jgi:hypothetical protein
LPANGYCTFLPSVVPFSVATDQATTVQLTLWTNIGPGTVPNQAEMRRQTETIFIALLGPFGLLILSRRKAARWFVSAIVLAIATGMFSGCSTALPPATALTPAGSSTVIVQATGPNGQSHTLAITLDVIAQ